VELEIERVHDRLAIDRDDPIPRSEAEMSGIRVGLDRLDDPRRRRGKINTLM
jgi:hypothetical protein